MNAKKCDRCGAYYELKEAGLHDPIAEAMRRITSNLSCGPAAGALELLTEKVDLCPSCEKSLRAWWRRKEGERDELHPAPTDGEEQNNGNE